MHAVKEIVIYPIKSLGGISVNSSSALVEGFEHDRRWMLINDSGKFMSQRENAIMALFKTSITDDGVLVSYNSDSISIPFAQNEEEVLNVSVWNSKMKAQEVNTDISKWFTEHLKMNVKLVSMTDVSKRYKRLFKDPFKTYVSFADGYPYLILGEESMTHLNDKLEAKINIDRFRANIIVSSQKPHEEDTWENFNVGSAQMTVIKPCARCVVTTIDQSTGKAGKEPLKTLNTYRKKGNKINFGANAIILQEGKISVGDSLKF